MRKNNNYMMSPWVFTDEALIDRMNQDGRKQGIIEDSVKRLKLYESMDMVKIDTTDLNIRETVDRIVAIIN